MSVSEEIDRAGSLGASAGQRREGAVPSETVGASIPRPDEMLDGQPYWLVGFRPHRTRDDRDVRLKVWRSFCPVCSEPFEFTGPDGDRFNPSRRCTEHRQPGRPVVIPRRR